MEAHGRVLGAAHRNQPDGNRWTPVEANTPFGVQRDAWNVARFVPVRTSALRIELVMQEKFSAGVRQWKVKEHR